MKSRERPVKGLVLGCCLGMAATMALAALALYGATGNGAVWAAWAALTPCALGWMLALTCAFGRRLARSTAALCGTLDRMMDGAAAPDWPPAQETLLARIGHRLVRLYQVMQEDRRRVEAQRRDLQGLVTDISHQIKAPVANLKLAADTLLAGPVEGAERQALLQGIRSQAGQLEFLVQALVKTSRLETGLIRLEKKPGRLYDTVAQALGGIVYGAEQKGIAVTVDCPEDLTLAHDAKWTAEALFNLLDNAVKYTPPGGRVAVSVDAGEMYAEVRVTDTGPGIPEGEQGAIFRRFYRGQAVRQQPGVGIGLYLARQIATRQGGYIRVRSQVGRGSAFSLMLPRR